MTLSDKPARDLPGYVAPKPTHDELTPQEWGMLKGGAFVLGVVLLLIAIFADISAGNGTLLGLAGVFGIWFGVTAE